jgi:hypothetical protein
MALYRKDKVSSKPLFGVFFHISHPNYAPQTVRVGDSLVVTKMDTSINAGHDFHTSEL